MGGRDPASIQRGIDRVGRSSSLAFALGEGRKMIQLEVNGVEQSFGGEPEMPLLWYLRDVLGLTGSKFGCGIGLCGACTVHVTDSSASSPSGPHFSADGFFPSCCTFGKNSKGCGGRPVRAL